MPAGRLEGVLGQRRAARGDGPDPNADVPCEDNWRSGGLNDPWCFVSKDSKAHRVVITGLISIDVYTYWIILYHAVSLYHSLPLDCFSEWLLSLHFLMESHCFDLLWVQGPGLSFAKTKLRLVDLVAIFVMLTIYISWQFLECFHGLEAIGDVPSAITRSPFVSPKHS